MTVAEIVFLQVVRRLIVALFREINEKLKKMLQSPSFKALLINKRGFKIYNSLELGRKRTFVQLLNPFYVVMMMWRRRRKGRQANCAPYGWCQEGARCDEWLLPGNNRRNRNQQRRGERDGRMHAVLEGPVRRRIGRSSS